MLVLPTEESPITATLANASNGYLLADKDGCFEADILIFAV